MKRIGFVGWRGMVGSVLMDRMKAENDFRDFEPVFFSTSNIGGAGPSIEGVGVTSLQDAHNIDALKQLDIVVSCQGGDYTTEVYPKLRSAGFTGYFIDAASTLRMKDHAVIVLDPVNRKVIDRAIRDGIKDFIGGNCTTSLMLMAAAGLIEQGWVEWISSMTYQSASGAGAKNMQELCAQMYALGLAAEPILKDPAKTALDVDRAVAVALTQKNFPKEAFGVPLAASIIPWIDKPVENGQTREEWKGFAETNKIMGLNPPVPVDGICVRVGAMRCHSQGLTIKLRKDIPIADLEATMASHNPWVKIVPNTMDETRARLTPAAVSGTLDIAVGRIHKMKMGPEYVTLFTVGDQLLWGAAEPVRRVLNILLGRA